MICRYCNQETKLIKSHIVPEKFYLQALDRTQKNDKLIIIDKRKKYTPASPIGLYDLGILCASCDGKLGVFDNAAQLLFLKDIQRYKSPDKDLYVLPLSAFDYQKIKLFIVSVLWRASISTLEAFEAVQLGYKYEKIALDIIKDPSKDDDDTFAFFVLKFKNKPNLRMDGIFVPPMRNKIDGINSYRFVFAGYVFHIKVDSRKYPPLFHGLCLSSKRDFLIIETSPENEKFTLEHMNGIRIARQNLQ